MIVADYAVVSMRLIASLVLSIGVRFWSKSKSRERLGAPFAF